VAGATLPVASTFEAAREEFERRFVRAALASANGQRGRAAGTVRVHMQDANVDVRVLVDRLLALAKPGVADGVIDVSTFDVRFPDDRVRVVFEAGQAWVEEPALFDETPAAH